MTNQNGNKPLNDEELDRVAGGSDDVTYYYCMNCQKWIVPTADHQCPDCITGKLTPVQPMVIDPSDQFSGD